MTEYKISQINNFLMRKQHLSEETKSQSVLQVTKDIWGLHATYASTPYLSLFNRMINFKKESLDRELQEKRLVKIRCVRKTLHIIPKENVSAAFSATKESIQINSEKYYKFMGVSESEYEAASKSILELLGNNGMNASEIKKELRAEINLSPIINYMCDLGILVRGISKGGWKSNTHTYYRTDKYLLDINLSEYSQDEARKVIVSQYLSSFGPLTITDISWWTGFPKTGIKKILDSLGGTEYVDISGLGEYIISKDDQNQLKNIKENNNSQINLLPALDPYIMGYKERERYLDKEYFNYIFDRSGSGTTTIVNNGKIIGVWDFEENPSPVVKIFMFEDRNIPKEIENNAREIGKFICEKEVMVKICDDMTPLDKRTTGGFMTPLKDSSS
ncbi:MAG TPA: crosslink repair DNA glycosylase YcaQ family protein [Methanofastidiosum sp.]|nr:crosslink repair DNA glycosylase YcaQ family protein [Methanofastidiosum sp.]HNU61240.1 crosslink repair DNA glycosylase YcaQ family protein [Methanofastidiosum sp.]